MTAGTVVITGGILATIILLCIIAVLCYCRLQYYCCKKEESESEEEEPDFAVTSRLPPVHSNHNIVAAAAASSSSSVPNGPALFSTPPLARKLTRSQTYCPSCTHYELPFYLQPPPPPPPPPQQLLPQHHLLHPHPLPRHTYHQPHPDGLRNGGERLSGYRGVLQQDLDVPVPVSMAGYRKNNLTRAVTMRDMFTRSCSISTDV
ncbi:Protein FAM163B [Merluccius polli]|uniref:Protein FAM163B n=1 Tax=Merluccius polli TaxID=89951 RepID=A0AA47NMW4_MERPO|nr:Protein FAM163B [Merluccius polli]